MRSDQLDLLPRPVAVRPTRSIQQARAVADGAIAGTEARTERDAPGWLKLAIDRVRAFAAAQAHGTAFTVESMRMVLEQELPEPPEKRVWGAVTRRAIRDGLIEAVPRVTMPAASSNGSPKPAYRRGPKA